MKLHKVKMSQLMFLKPFRGVLGVCERIGFQICYMSMTNNNGDFSNSLQSGDAVQTRMGKAEVNYEVLASNGKYIYCKSDNLEVA